MSPEFTAHWLFEAKNKLAGSDPGNMTISIVGCQWNRRSSPTPSSMVLLKGKEE